jgi:hypothetical protein
VSVWIEIDQELGALPMALRMWILACLLSMPAARLSRCDATPVGKLHVLPEDASDSRMADGHLLPLVGCEDLLGPPESLADDEGEDYGDVVKALASAIREVGGSIRRFPSVFRHRPPHARLSAGAGASLSAVEPVSPSRAGDRA